MKTLTTIIQEILKKDNCKNCADDCHGWEGCAVVSIIKAVSEYNTKVVGEDENEYSAQMVEGSFTGLVNKTGEEIPLRMLNKQSDRNDLRAEIRTKQKELL